MQHGHRFVKLYVSCVYVLLYIFYPFLWLSLGLYENHGAKVKKSRHTFRKFAKFTANSQCQFTVIYSVKNVSLTNIFVLCLVNNQSCIVVSQND